MFRAANLFATATLSALKYIKSSNFYNVASQFDTIYAPASAINPGLGSPLGVVRISGKRTQDILELLTKKRAVKDLDDDQLGVIRPRYATKAKISNPSSNELIDVALILWFPAPRSYTGEDVAELHLHGSIAVMKNVMNILGSQTGLRPAEPGEFTKRAVINKKMSLVEAESLPDFIASKTDCQRRLALSGLNGSVRAKYESWIELLIKVLAHVEASIDFGEDELLGERLVVSNCIEILSKLACDVEKHIKLSSSNRQLIRDGVQVVILGRPNAGKSTLMNLLCQQEKSIVSNLSGTTRDIVEHSFELGGFEVKLHDTAGLRESSGWSTDASVKMHQKIEAEGIRRALEVSRKADIILYLLDSSALLKSSEVIENIKSHICEEIHEAFDLSEHKPKILYLVFNKIDLNDLKALDVTNYSNLQQLLGLPSYIKLEACSLSCKTLANYEMFMSQLICSLKELASFENSKGQEFSFTNERHLSLLRSVQRNLVNATKLEFENLEIVAQLTRDATDYLSQIIGSVSNEEVFDIIFRDFCIGK